MSGLAEQLIDQYLDEARTHHAVNDPLFAKLGKKNGAIKGSSSYAKFDSEKNMDAFIKDLEKNDKDADYDVDRDRLTVTNQKEGPKIKPQPHPFAGVPVSGMKKSRGPGQVP